MDPIIVDARWDAEAGVWIGSSRQVPGLVLEAAGWPEFMEETRLVLPDLLALNGRNPGSMSVTFRVEEEMKLEPA